MRNFGLLVAGFYTVVSGVAVAAPLVASSSATILHGAVSIGGTPAVIPPQAPAADSGSGPYVARKSVATFASTISLPLGTTLSVKTGALADLVSSAGLVAGAITAKASSAQTAPVYVLSNPFASGTVTVKASRIVSVASFTARTAGAPSYSGTAVITGGSVDLTLFGGGVVTYSGTPKANSVLYKSKDGTVTVVGNQQVIAHAAGSTVAAGITVNAIDVHLAGAKVLGQVVNGDVVVGTSSAK